MSDFIPTCQVFAGNIIYEYYPCLETIKKLGIKKSFITQQNFKGLKEIVFNANENPMITANTAAVFHLKLKKK